MKFKELLKSKLLYKNILIAILVTLVLLSGVSFMLDAFTRHGDEKAVKSLLGMTPDEVDDYLTRNDFRVEVLDSVFTDTYPKGTVCKQDPEEGSMVKKNRKIYISYVARQQEMVEMPNLDDLTVRQAVAVVYSNGLSMGKIIYEDGFDRNAVQSALCNKKRVAVGTLVAKDSRIDLYVSSGSDRESVAVPRVVGQQLRLATMTLFALGFNVSKINYDGSCENVDNAKLGVYKQIPVGNKSNFFPLGTSVELWVKPIDLIRDYELEIVDDTIVADTLNLYDEF